MERKRKKKYWYLILSIAIVAVVFPFGMKQMNSAVLRNAQLMGQEVAKRFALNEAVYTDQYETIVETMEYQLRPENRVDSIDKLFKNYLEFIHETMDVEELEIYAFIDGKIKAVTFWEGDEEYEAESTEWYKKAIEADGETIYTDAYIDVRLNKKVVTVAKKIQGTQDVVAVDIYPSSQKNQRAREGLPEGSYIYLSDGKGTILDYHMDNYDVSDIQNKYDEIFAEILAGKHDAYDSYVNGLDGQKRGVYYYRLDSGWYSVITIPYKELLKDNKYTGYIFAGVMGIFSIMVLIFIILDYRTNKKAQLYNEIVGVLGNSYYALYLIHLEQRQYFMLKGSDYVKSKIPSRDSYKRLLDIMPEIIEGKDCEKFLEAFSIENMKILVKERVRDFGGDFKRLFNNEYRWVHVHMLYDESLQKNTVVLGFKDVNEAKEQEISRLEFLKNSLETVDRMAKSKNIFFSQMSHDMRTPLNGIIGLSKLALEHPEEKGKVRETLEKVVSLSNQLLSLINDILDISKMEEGKLEVRSESFRIKERIQELAAIFQLQTEKKEKTFVVDIEIEDISIQGDWGKLQQILNNLLSNAFKFTAKDGTVRLSVSETRDNNSRYIKYYFTVQDNGSGMSKEFLKKIFIPFERETQFGAANVAGTGLGMPIVYELVHKMEGSIDVESELGKGSCFKVMLPFRIDDEAKETEKIPLKSREKKEADLSGRRALLAEDNEINMEIATEVLKMYELEVVQAWNGKEAVEQFENSEEGYFDFILMDMQMPVMDGCQAAEAIRKSRRKDAKTIPIIAVTANAFAEDIALTKKAGMNAHISKPIDFNILREEMGKYLKD